MVENGNITINDLVKKFQKFSGKHPWGQDINTGVPYIKDVNEIIVSIANMSNNIKLDKAWKCISKDINIEQSINQIYNYVSNAERAFYVSNEFRKIILSSSIIPASIIAYILGNVIHEDRECTHSEIIVSTAVISMTDYDIKNFIYITEKCKTQLGEHEIIDMTQIPSDAKESFMYTIQLCVAHGLFIDQGPIVSDSCLNAGAHYKETMFSDVLKQYIDDVKQILRYNE